MDKAVVIIGTEEFVKWLHNVGVTTSQYRTANDESDLIRVLSWPESDVFTKSGLTFDPLRMVVWKGPERIHLTPNELHILMFLAKNCGRTFSPTTLITRALSKNSIGQEEDLNELKVYIRRIRLKIEVDPSSPKILKTNRGFGYYFECNQKL